MATEREVYQTSRDGLDTMYQQLQAQLKDETQTRLVSARNW